MVWGRPEPEISLNQLPLEAFLTNGGSYFFMGYDLAPRFQKFYVLEICLADNREAIFIGEAIHRVCTDSMQRII